MPAWFSQATAHTSASTSTTKTKTKKTFAATRPKPLAPLRVVGRRRPPPVRMLPHSSPRPQHLTSPGSGARAGKAAGDAKGLAKPSRLPFSSIQPEAGGAAAYPLPDSPGATRTVRFQLPPSPLLSSSAEPSPQHQPQVKTVTAARGPEYVTITRPEHELQRRSRPEPLHLRPAPAGYAYGYPYSPFSLSPSPYDGAFGGRENAAPAPAVRASRISIGPLKLLKPLQSGAFGACYVAHDIATGRVVCARTVKKDVLDRNEKLKRGLLVEAQCYKTIAAGLARDRAHLMEAHGILQDESQIVFVMPLMQCDLLDALATLGVNGRLDRALIRRWVAQLALGVDALHRMGIIHRDLKPENVLLDGGGADVRITDFNAALFVQNGGQPLADGDVYARDKVGSEPYIAWETAHRRWYGKMVDWWALGCVMFDLLTNTVLFENHGARKTYASWDRRLEGMSFLQAAGDLTDEEESVIGGLVDLHPCSRYQLRHLRHHAYFFDANNRTNVFDALVREPATDLLSVGRPTHPSLLQVDDTLRDAPLCHAGPRPLKVRRGSVSTRGKVEVEGEGEVDLRLGGVGDFGGFGWVNGRGIWGGWV